jgi:hypothetical protein
MLLASDRRAEEVGQMFTSSIARSPVKICVRFDLKPLGGVCSQGKSTRTVYLLSVGSNGPSAVRVVPLACLLSSYLVVCLELLRCSLSAPPARTEKYYEQVLTNQTNLFFAD